MAEAPVLAIEDLTAGYGGVVALHGVSLSAGQGTVTAVLGANSAGKTTLLRAISGLVRVRTGHVLLDGAEVTRRRPEDMARAGIAHVPEGQGVITELTVEENLRLGALARTDRAGGPARSRRPTSSSRCWPPGGASRPRRCPAASGRCW